MYRNLLNNARRKRIYNENIIHFDLLDKKKTTTKKKKPINFNNGDHLGDQFHFLLKKEYQLRKNSDDLPPFLL